MPRYLSREWIGDLSAQVDASAALADVAGQASLRLTQVVTGAPGGDVTYHLAVSDGSATFASGAAADEEVRLESNWVTAVAVATGQLNAQDAFIQGRIRLHGDQAKLVAAVPVLSALDALVADLRPRTTYE